MSSMADCGISVLENLEKGADEEAISRALGDARSLLVMRCRPVDRAYECVRVADWLSTKAISTLRQCPCWEAIPPHTLSLIMYLVTQSVTFYLRGKAEDARAGFRWWSFNNIEFRIQRLLPWVLHESRSLGMPAIRVCLLRCICDGFARAPNVTMYKSECGAEVHLTLAEFIFQRNTDLSIGEGVDVRTDIDMGMQLSSSQQELSSDVVCAAGSSNIKGTDTHVELSDVAGVDGSSNRKSMDDARRASSINVTSSVVTDLLKSEGMNASSHAKDVGAQRKKDMEMKIASCACSMEVNNALDTYPHEENSDMKRASELVECLHWLDMAKELVPSDSRFLKWRISILRAQVKLAAVSLCAKLYVCQKIKLPVVSQSLGGGASNFLGNTLRNHIAPPLKGKHWLYLTHIGVTMSLLLYNESRKR